MDLTVNLADITSRYFLENMGHPEPMKIVIIKKCPELLRIYGDPQQNILIIVTNKPLYIYNNTILHGCEIIITKINRVTPNEYGGI